MAAKKIGPEGRVIGIDSSAAQLHTARGRGGPPGYARGSAVSLPIRDGAFDAVVACLLLEHVEDLRASVAEAARSLRPGGRFLFFEHVVHPEARTRRWQNRLNPLWQKLACGCQLNRDTDATFREAGLRYESFERYRHPKVPALAGTIIRGVATKP